MGNNREEKFQRTYLLLGDEIMEKGAAQKVIIFGIGGVGSWCAESLIRSGIFNLTIVDPDVVCVTNINRQLHATTTTVGMFKTEVLKKRLLEINPSAQIVAINEAYCPSTYHSFDLGSYDYIIDAIDSVSDKTMLIREATRTKAVFFSSMGASLKIDPAKIQIAEFWKVNGCPLAATVRKRLRQGEMPGKKFLCVFSNELLENKGTPAAEAKDSGDGWTGRKTAVNGTVAHIAAIFGFTLAGLVMRHIYNEELNNSKSDI